MSAASTVTYIQAKEYFTKSAIDPRICKDAGHSWTQRISEGLQNELRCANTVEQECFLAHASGMYINASGSLILVNRAALGPFAQACVKVYMDHEKKHGTGDIATRFNARDSVAKVFLSELLRNDRDSKHVNAQPQPKAMDVDVKPPLPAAAAAGLAVGNDIAANIAKIAAEAKKAAEDAAKNAPPAPQSRAQQRAAAVAAAADEMARLDLKFQRFSIKSQEADVVRDRAVLARSKVIAAGMDKNSAEAKTLLATAKYDSKVANRAVSDAKKDIHEERSGQKFEAEEDCDHVLTHTGTMQMWANEVACGSSHVAALQDCDVYMTRFVKSEFANDILALVTPADFARMQNGANLSKTGSAPKEAPNSRTCLRYKSQDASGRKERFVVLDHTTLALIGSKEASASRCWYERQINSHRVTFALRDAQMPGLEAGHQQQRPVANASSVSSRVTPGGMFQAH